MAERRMAQMGKSGCDAVRTNSRVEIRVPQVSVRQEILTSLVSALDSVVRSLTIHWSTVCLRKTVCSWIGQAISKVTYHIVSGLWNKPH